MSNADPDLGRLADALSGVVTELRRLANRPITTQVAETPQALSDQMRLYSVSELARLWRVGQTYIYDEIRAKRLPAIQLGHGDRNKLRVSATDAAAWIAAHRAASTRP